VNVSGEVERGRLNVRIVDAPAARDEIVASWYEATPCSRRTNDPALAEPWFRTVTWNVTVDPRVGVGGLYVTLSTTRSGRATGPAAVIVTGRALFASSDSLT